MLDGCLLCFVAVSNIRTTFFLLQGDDSDEMDEEDKAAAVYSERGYIIKAPNLQRLVIHDLSVSLGPNYFDLLLKPLTKLTHLDLSGAEHREGFGHLVGVRCWRSF